MPKSSKAKGITPLEKTPRHLWRGEKSGAVGLGFICHTHFLTGFTLAELMIVLAIMAVLGAIATPALLSQLPDYRLKGTAREISSTLHYAKMSAASTGKEYRLQFILDTSPQRYQLQQGNLFSKSDHWTNTRIFQDIPQQVRIDHATDYKGSHQTGIGMIAFNPTGTASSGGVYLKNSKGRHCSVKVSSATGRIRIDDKW
jgi:type II secretion system protein H